MQRAKKGQENRKEQSQSCRASTPDTRTHKAVTVQGARTDNRQTKEHEGSRRPTHTLSPDLPGRTAFSVDGTRSVRHSQARKRFQRRTTQTKLEIDHDT